MDEELGKGTVEVPERLAILADKEKVASLLSKEWAPFREWLGDNIA